MDDFIQIRQGGPWWLKALHQHLFHTINSILYQPGLDETHCNEAVSLQKLLQGDGSWCTQKLTLGWILDTVCQTMELPPHCKATLMDIFKSLSHHSCVSSKEWQHILG